MLQLVLIEAPVLQRVLAMFIVEQALGNVPVHFEFVLDWGHGQCTRIYAFPVDVTEKWVSLDLLGSKLP